MCNTWCYGGWCHAVAASITNNHLQTTHHNTLYYFIRVKTKCVHRARFICALRDCVQPPTDKQTSRHNPCAAVQSYEREEEDR